MTSRNILLLPFGGASCAICGRIINNKRDYEATQSKGRRKAYFHRSCIEREQEEIRRKRGGRA